MTALLGGLAALALAIAGQGFVAERTFLLDGIFLYLIALVVGLRAIDLPQRADDLPTEEAGPAGVGTSLLRAERIGMILAAVAVVAIVGSLWLFGRRASPNLAWFLFAVAVIATPVAVWLWSGRPRLRPFGGWSHADLFAFGAVVVIALFFRLYQINEVPWGLWWDEANSGLYIERIMREANYRPVYVAEMAQEPSMIWYFNLPFFWIFGSTQLALRMVGVLGGMVGVVALVFLGRELFGRRVGIVAGALMAMMVWHVNFSRIAFNVTWSVAFDALATYLLVQGMRTRRLTTFALGGVTLGMGVHMYYTSRLMPLILGAYLVWRFLFPTEGDRIAFLRRHGIGLVIFAAATLITIAPLAQFAVLYPQQFTSRMNQASIMKEVDEKKSYQPIVENVKKHLVMFHYAGDTNGRHNLPGAPMLVPTMAALFTLGLGMALRRVRRPESFLLVAWVPVMLIGGVFSLSFEAPQGIRSIDETTAVAILGALPLVALWNRLGALPLGELRLPTFFQGMAPISLSAAGVLVVFFLGWAASQNYDRYFNQQARNFSVWNSFSAAETEIARQINALPGEYRVYLGETLTDKPTIHFLGKQHKPYSGFDPAGMVPLRINSNVAIFLEGEQERTAALLRHFYPQAEYRAFRSPYGGPVVMHAVIIPKEQVESLQGMAIAYYGTADWRGEPLRRERVTTTEFDWQTQVPLPTPFSVELRSTLAAPIYGRYVFHLDAPPGSELLIDETPLAQAGETNSAILAKGNHSLRVRLAVPQPSRVRLLWQPPSQSQLAPIPRAMLFVPPVSNNGLLGNYYSNRNWTGAPAFQQNDPSMDIRIHVLPLPRPYTVEWRGKIDIPREGIYRFAVEAADAGWVYVDETLVVTNEGAPRQLREGAIRLTEGFHDIRIRFLDSLDHTFIKVWWTPPNGQRQILPSERLFPPQGAYRERARDLAPLPSAAPAPTTTPQPALPPAAAAGAVGALPAAKYSLALTIGAPGEGDGQFVEPRGVAVDAQGNVYVVDTGNRRIQKFDKDGKFVAKWGRRGEGDAEFMDPVAAVVDPNGNVLVLDSQHGWIKRFSPTGQLIGAYGGPNGAFYHPRGIGIDAQGNFYIADTGTSKIAKFNPNGELVGRFGEKGNGPGQITEPTDVAPSSDGTFYVAESALSKIIWFDANWRAQAEWPVPKSGSVYGPHLALGGSAGIFVADPEGKRIIRFNVAGTPVDQIALDGQFERPLQIAFDRAGNLYVADSGSHQVFKFSPTP